MHINILKLKAVHLALLTFIRIFPKKAFHVQIDNMIALAYLVKMRGSSNQQMRKHSKQIQSFLLSREVTITAEYLLGVLNMREDRTSCHFVGKSEWLLCRKVLKLLFLHCVQRTWISLPPWSFIKFQHIRYGSKIHRAKQKMHFNKSDLICILCLFPILHKRQSTGQNKTGESNHSLDNSSLADTTMVHSNSQNICRESASFTKHPQNS